MKNKVKNLEEMIKSIKKNNPPDPSQQSNGKNSMDVYQKCIWYFVSHFLFVKY